MTQGLFARFENSEDPIHRSQPEQLLNLSAATRAVHERNMRKMQCRSDIALGNRCRDLLLEAWGRRGVKAALDMTRAVPASCAANSMFMRPPLGLFQAAQD